MDLEEFMDVVTSYKCKFCAFTANNTVALGEHIKAEHLKQAVPQTSDVQTEPSQNSDACTTTEVSVGTDTGDAAFQENPDSEDPLDQGVEGIAGQVISLHPDNQQPITKELFLCGQCNAGFGSIDDCKNHMVRDHNIVLQPAETTSSISDTAIEDDNRISVATQVIRKKPGRKRKSEMREPTPEPEVEEVYDRLADDGSSLGKRRIRMPKALQSDYYVQKFETKKTRHDKRDLMAPFKIKCSIKGCGARFKTPEGLDAHSACHHNEKGFKCSQCDVVQEQWPSMRMHLWKTHRIDTDLFQCEHCDFRINSATKLLTHKAIHYSERPHTCRTCGKGFKQPCQARNHEMTHNPRSDEELGENHWSTKKHCDICNRWFSNLKSLKKHIEAVHDKVKPFVCPYCPHTAARKAMMQLHMRTHTGEKPFKCDVCQYTTGDHNSLRRHKMRHTGQKPYKCPHCSYSCIQAISLKMHMKSKHFGQEGLYVCIHCSFHTINKKTFNEHVDDHKNGLILQKAAAPATEPPANNVVEANVISGGSDISSAQFNLIYSALTAISQNNGSIPQGATITEDGNQTQTITIHLPPQQGELSQSGQVVLAVQQPEEARVQFVEASEVTPMETENKEESGEGDSSNEHVLEVKEGTYVEAESLNEMDVVTV